MTSYYGTGTDGLTQPDLATLNSQTKVVSAEDALASDDFRMARKLYEFWRALSPGIPQCDQLKFGQLDPALMSNMVILDVLDDGDYKWRLFGTMHADQYGDDLTGRNVSSVIKENPSVKTLNKIFDQAKAEPDGIFFELHYLNEDNRVRVAAGLIVPLADSQGTISQLCGCCDWN
jgi:hypothetical protein